MSPDRVEGTQPPTPEKKFPLVRGEGLFPSRQSVYTDLINLEGYGRSTAERIVDPELTDNEVIDAIEQLFWRASYTFSENLTGENADISRRLFYVFDDFRWICQAMRERLKNESNQQKESTD